jgi:hypothetical protein
MKVAICLNILIMLLTSSGTSQLITIRDFIKVSLSTDSKFAIIDSSEFIIRVNIQNKRKGDLILEKPELWSFVGDPNGFCLIQTQRKENGVFVTLEPQACVDGISPSNDTLISNDARSFTFPVQRLYRYIRGQYRMRVLIKLSDLNPIPDVYTDWLYFASTGVKGKLAVVERPR